VPLTSFVGRERAAADVRELVQRSRLVTLTGPGGVGKTRLAIEVARRRRARSVGTVAFADLGSVGERAAVAAAVAEAIGLAAAGPGRAEVALADWLADQSLLIVLDNCEHMVGACAELAAGLLGRCPGLRILATSRESLGVPGEAVWMVAPLSLEESRRLFIARAGEARPAAAPGGEQDEAVLAICRRLDGIPLALEPAAAQVAVLSPAEIVPLLEGRLAGGWRAGRLAPAQQTLRASIQWSYELLAPAERAAFARLAVFTGAFGRDAAGEVARADVPMLAALAAKSMIYVVPGPVRTRYRMLDTLRAFGLERLAATGEEAGLRERHLAWWVGRAESACGHGTVPASAQGFEELCEDIDDLRAALRFAAEQNPAAGLAVMGSTRELWYRTAQPEGLERSLRFLELCPEPGRERAYALITAGRLATTVMDQQLARRMLAEALPMAGGSGDDGIEPLACFLLGVSLFLSGQLDQARKSLSRALELYSAAGDRCGIGRSTATLGVVAFFGGDWPSATAILEQALALLTAAGDRWGQGLCHTYLGLTAKEASGMRGAERHLLEGLRLLAPLRDVAILGIAIAALAAVQVTRAPGGGARRRCRRAGRCRGPLRRPRPERHRRGTRGGRGRARSRPGRGRLDRRQPAAVHRGGSARTGTIPWPQDGGTRRADHPGTPGRQPGDRRVDNPRDHRQPDRDDPGLPERAPAPARQR
jgi:predicted ATPase